MGKITQKKSSKVMGWIHSYPQLKYDEGIVFCKVCGKNVGCDRKSQIDAHCSTSSHLENIKKNDRKPVQTLITPSCSSKCTEQQEFFLDLCNAMVTSNIPFYKLKSPTLRDFLKKFTKHVIPDESTLRKNYLKTCFDNTMEKIKSKIASNYFFVMVDETTDARGLYICSCLIGVLHPESSSKAYLISCKVLDKTNSETVSKFINDTLSTFFKDRDFQEKVLVFISDAAPYMVKTGNVLKEFYHNMVHVTCVAHGLNRVAEKIRELFPQINKLVNNGKKLFLKAPHRVTLYKSVMECQLPPDVVLTRWGTWLEAALFYGANFPSFKNLILQLEEDAQSVVKVKNIVNTNLIVSDLTFVSAHFAFFPGAIKKLEERNLTLNDQIKIIEEVEKNLQKIENPKGKTVLEKYNSVFKKNPGYETLKNINYRLNGENAECETKYSDPKVLSCFKQCPITSVEVERSFSQLKQILSDKRYGFTEFNLEMYVVTHYNSHNE